MNGVNGNKNLTGQVGAAARVAFSTMLVCSLLYPLSVLVIGQTFVPCSADGSLVRNGRNEVVGSELIAQGFSRAGYFWPRPSAVDYNAASAGGSNLSPASPALRDRAKALVTRFGDSARHPLPADLVTASGSGLDPDITLAAAFCQAKRVASARGLSEEDVMKLLDKYAQRSGGALRPQPLVNVLLVNMALDRLGK